MTTKTKWKIEDIDGMRFSSVRITCVDDPFSWAEVRQRGDIVGFTSAPYVGQEVVEAAVEILRRYTETGKIWALEPEPALEQFFLPCTHCGKSVRFAPDSLEAQGVLVPFCKDGACEDMFAAGL